MLMVGEHGTGRRKVMYLNRDDSLKLLQAEDPSPGLL